ncbi:TPR-like protein [Rhizoclosmatium globosum]|uniref:TPR-like protein n=1 Tax=Rhizoclosmatium globosum TaxID=329046 RepID=A0A1Y2CMI3_9FUNG|nr:TPR-like protein [Rhizoclosmatium globosum]|eukprot:ORY48229.1 TPR-like protein [Rhizoclosmatium globosum]
MGHAIYGVEEQMACTALMDLADVWTAQERFEEAEAAYKYCYYRCLKLFGDQNRITASCARRMVGCLRASDKTQIANQLLFKLLDFHYDLMKVDEVAAADYFFDVAAVFVVEGGYDKVEEMVSQALQERAERLGNSHPNTVVAAVLLGTLYRTLGKYEEATMIFEESLETNRRILGNFHPNTLESINGLGQLYGRQGRFEEAEALLKESVETHRLLFTSSHSKTLSAISELAALYKADHTIPGNLERAVSLFEEYKKTSEFLQIIVANSRALYPVGQELTNLRAVTGCSVYIDSSITIRPSSTLVNGESVIETRVPPSYISCLSNLGKLYVLQGKMQEAYDCFHPCFFLSLDLYGRTNAATLDAQLQLGKFYFQIGAFKHADNILADCWLLQSDVFGNEHKSTLETMLFWAQTKDQLQKTEEAKRMYVSCLDSLRNIVDDNDPLVILCLNRLATLCTLQKDFAGSIPLYSALYAALVREGLELIQRHYELQQFGMYVSDGPEIRRGRKVSQVISRGTQDGFGLAPRLLEFFETVIYSLRSAKEVERGFSFCTEGHDGSLKLLGESDPKTVFWKETLEYISGKIVD